MERSFNEAGIQTLGRKYKQLKSKGGYMKSKSLKQVFVAAIVCFILIISVSSDAQAETTEEKLLKIEKDISRSEKLIIEFADMLAYLNFKVNAVIELLEQKGVFTQKELNQKFQEKKNKVKK